MEYTITISKEDVLAIQMLIGDKQYECRRLLESCKNPEMVPILQRRVSDAQDLGTRFYLAMLKGETWA